MTNDFLSKIAIAKKKDLVLKEESFDDNFLSEILKENGYKITENNISILKERLITNTVLAEDFRVFLLNEGISLNEEVLTEGKFLNKIRWKLAKYALKFLKEDTLNEIIIGYYGEEKAKEKLSLKKKEKVKIVREIADKLPDEKKTQVANNEAAKKLERSGVLSADVGVATGAIAGTAAILGTAGKLRLKNKSNWYGDAAGQISTGNYGPEPITNNIPLGKYGDVASALSILANVIGGVVIGAIVAGVIGLVRGTVKAGMKFHQANSMRASEIADQLKNSNKEENLKEDLEFSDYDYYRLLEANHFKTNNKNLLILKEGILSGKYILA